MDASSNEDSAEGLEAEPRPKPAISPPPPVAGLPIASEPEVDSSEDQALRGSLVKSLLAVLVNVGVITALLVYFGWVRSDRMATMLGIDEAILGMTVDDYVRRSVRSVFVLPVVAGLAGLAWVALDQWWQRRLVRRGPDDAAVVFVARWLWVAAVATFAVGIALWVIGYAVTYMAGPLVCVAGVLLLLYSLSLRSRLPGAVTMAPLTDGVLRGSVAVLVAVGLFWSATNFATVEGTELAREFPDRVVTLPRVEIDSGQPLDIVAPGVETSCFGTGESIRYHYRGLRLLESTGGRYFLISDGWTPEYGVVVVLPTDGDGLRFTFVRDIAGDRPGGMFVPCAQPMAPVDQAGAAAP